jgi:hypothetical protein
MADRPLLRRQTLEVALELVTLDDLSGRVDRGLSTEGRRSLDGIDVDLHDAASP